MNAGQNVIKGVGGSFGMGPETRSRKVGCVREGRRYNIHKVMDVSLSWYSRLPFFSDNIEIGWLK